MPWRERSPMEQRADFVREFESGLFTMTELAAQYGISRKTGYKWVAAYEAGGLAGLQDRSRRPHHSPHATDEDVIRAILAIRRRHPSWGPKKLLAIAQGRHHAAVWPARSTIAALLKRRGLVTPRRRRSAPSAATASAGGGITQPNAVWTVDYKGEFLTGDRRYCYPFTLRDGFSRYVLRCDALTAHTLAVTRPRPRLHPPETDCAKLDLAGPPPPGGFCGGIRTGIGRLTGKTAPMRQLASVLTGVVQRLVVDRTNLTGVFDFDLEFSPMPLNADAADIATSIGNPISLFTALQEQLGLKLQPQRGPIDYVVIDSVEPPSEN